MLQLYFLQTSARDQCIWFCASITGLKHLDLLTKSHIRFIHYVMTFKTM